MWSFVITTKNLNIHTICPNNSESENLAYKVYCVNQKYTGMVIDKFLIIKNLYAYIIVTCFTALNLSWTVQAAVCNEEVDLNEYGQRDV